MTDAERTDVSSDDSTWDRYRTLIEASNDISTVIDPDGTITYVSPSVRRVLGFEPADLIGAVGYEYQHPDDRKRVADALESILDTPGASQTVETRFRQADGSWRWVEATIQNTLDNDAIDGILVNSRDITERKHQQEEFQGLAREYKALLENVPDAVFLIGVEHAPSASNDDIEFRFERLSPSHETQTGLTTEEIRGKTPREALGEKGGRTAAANYRRCVEAGESITYEEHLPLAGGTIAWQTNLAPVVLGGAVTRIIGISRDITAQKEYEQQLKEQRDNLDILNQVLRHDVRNELQLVGAYATMLAEEAEDEGTEHVARILDSADRAVELTKTAREMADVMLTDTDDRRAVDLRVVLHRVLRGVRTAHPNAIVTADGPLPLVTVLADDMLDSVLRNLLTNAIYHNDTDVPKVVVSVLERDEMVRVRVADNGPGVSDDRKDAIFGKGKKRLDSPGTGLGLHLVRSLVDCYGGDVWVEDNDPAGAVFVVELPISG